MTCDVMDAMLRLLFRDRRGENAIVLSTDVAKSGRREREQFRNVGGGHLVLAATNTLAQQTGESEKWNTLHPVATFLPTGNNEDYTNKRATSVMDGTVSASDRNASKIPTGDEMIRITSVLYMSSMMAGGMIGLMQQVGLLQVEIHDSKKEVMTWANHAINRMFSWCLHGRCLKGNFNRAYRVCLARAMADHTVDRVLHSFHTTKDFNKAFDAATTAIEINCIEPSGVIKFTHTALRQTIDMPFFVISKTIVQELNVPVVPFDWLKMVVQEGEVDLDHEFAVMIREWIRKLVSRNQFLPASNANPGFNGSVRVTPYVTSPCTPGGNVVDPRESMLCVDNANGTEAFSIACNMQPHLAGFFHVSNIDNEARNIVPALTKHATKVCDFEPLFGMARVLNVKFFIGIFFGADEFRTLPSGLFDEAIENKPTCGMFSRVEKVSEDAQAHTAYGMHCVVAIIIAAIMGKDMPVSPDCNTFLATKVITELMNYIPPTMIHPSGTDLVLRGFHGKSLQTCELKLPPRTDIVARCFFLRQRNDTSFSNKYPVMSMLDSPLRPYMFEDLVHVQWIAFLEKNHKRLIQDWNKQCLHASSRIEQRVVRVNDTLDKIVLSDLYRTLDVSMIPCDDTLIYGVHYPIIGTGVQHTTRLCGWRTVLGYVVMHCAVNSQIHIFETEKDTFVQDPNGGNDPQQSGDPGCTEKDFMVRTVHLFATMRKKNLIVLPLIARPSALLYYPSVNHYGTLQFNQSTGQCYDATTGKYTLRIPDADNNISEDEIEKVDGVALVYLNPVEVEQALITTPDVILADSRGFRGADGLPDPRLPIGATTRTYIKGILWYPHCMAAYTPDNVYILVRTGHRNSTSYDMMTCNVSFLVHPDTVDDTWETVSTIRTM
jgi:hypothetical protein